MGLILPLPQLWSILLSKAGVMAYVVQQSCNAGTLQVLVLCSLDELIDLFSLWPCKAGSIIIPFEDEDSKAEKSCFSYHLGVNAGPNTRQ